MRRPTRSVGAARRRPAGPSLAVALGAALALQACASGADRATLAGSKIGFILIGERDDLGYNQAVWEGSEAVARAFPDHFVLRREDVPETEAAEAALEALIRDGARILFATSYGHLAAAVAVARRHPEVVVLHQGGIEPKPGLDNLGTYWGSVFEPAYLAGIVAGRATRTGRLGYVVAFPIPATFNNVNAFTLGARSVRRDAVTEVLFTGDWCDPARQRDAARGLLRRGADVLAQHQDCTRTILEVAERARALSVGYHYDGSEVARRGWLTGPVWSWGPLFVEIVRTIVEGRFVGSPYERDYIGGLRSGDNPFVLTDLGPRVDVRTGALVARAEARLRRGGSPFDGPLADRDGKVRVPAGTSPTYDEILRMDYFVEGVLGEVPAAG